MLMRSRSESIPGAREGEEERESRLSALKEGR